MARTGVQPGSLILPVTQILLHQFEKDERSLVPVRDIVAELKKQTKKELTPGAVKAVLRDRFFGQLLVEDTVSLNPDWSTDEETSFQSFKKNVQAMVNEAQENRIKRERG